MSRARRLGPARPVTSRGTAARAAAGPSPAAARALLAGTLALLALRVLATVVPGRWLWGLDLGRDLAPASFWLPLALVGALAVPAVGRGLAGALPREPWLAGALAVALAAGLSLFACAHPDRSLYTGDASLRHGAFAALEHPERIAEQALPGDLALHHGLPRWVAAHLPWSAEQAGRAQGALLAFLTALAGWRLARALGASGELAVGVMAIAACTGALALDNGYGKASVEVACLATIAAVGVVRAAREGGGLGTVGAAVGTALLLHRSALMLVPAWLASLVLVVRAGRWRRPAALAGALAPALALVAVGGRLAHVLGTFDATHHVAGGSAARALAFALSPGHLLDVFHTLSLLVPLALLVPLLLALGPRMRRRDAVAAAALVLPPLALLVLVEPQHGLPRDWDVYAFAGSALAAWLAWRAADVLAAEPRARWVALPLAAAAAVPALQWAALQSDAPRAWARAEAILTGPPAREASERADGLGTIGMMQFARGRYDAAVRLFQRSAEAAPNPRTFVEWGMAEAMLGRPDAAMAQYLRAVSRNPDLVAGWRGVAAAASALGDRARMALAVAALERLEPHGETLRDARAWLSESEAGPRRPRPARRPSG